MGGGRRIRSWFAGDSGTAAAAPLPFPPPEMRDLVGGHPVELFDNPHGGLIHHGIPAAAFDSVLDVGCGCGRLARQLIQQDPQPREYVGVDLHRGMIAWCQANLAPHAEQFRFEHHDVYNLGLNPVEDSPLVQPLPDAPSGDGYSLVQAMSVYTHMLEEQAVHYMRETRRVLRPDGIALSTWFLFDKVFFPMMQDFQNALFINHVDLTNAVIFDREWLRRTAAEADLVIYEIEPPKVRGFQWRILMTPPRPGVVEAEWPEDAAPIGRIPPPMPDRPAHGIGLDDDG
jgi:SAM-dependent methyltransferase